MTASTPRDHINRRALESADGASFGAVVPGPRRVAPRPGPARPAAGPPSGPASNVVAFRARPARLPT